MATRTPEVQTEDGQEQQGDTAGSGVCGDCGGRIATEGTERVCQDCGLVDDEDRIDPGPEWRSFPDDEGRSKARAGTPVDRTRNDNGFDTQIGFEGGPKASERHRRLLRAQRFGRHGREKKQKEQGKLLSDIKRAASSLELPQSVSDNACVLFQQFHESDTHFGHSLDEMGAATIYAAARVGKAPIRPVDVCEQFDVDRQRLFKQITRMRRKIDVPLPVETPSMLVSRFVDDLGGEARTQTLARKLATEVEQTEFASSGTAPSALAASVVYESFLAAPWEAKRSQEEVGEVADTSPVSIRRHWRSMKEADIRGANTDLVE